MCGAGVLVWPTCAGVASSRLPFIETAHDATEYTVSSTTPSTAALKVTQRNFLAAFYLPFATRVSDHAS